MTECVVDFRLDHAPEGGQAAKPYSVRLTDYTADALRHLLCVHKLDGEGFEHTEVRGVSSAESPGPLPGCICFCALNQGPGVKQRWQR